MSHSPAGIDTSRRIEHKEWQSLTEYYAESTPQEKIYEIANYVLFGAALYGVCAYFSGSLGTFSHLACALASRKFASTMIGYLVYPAIYANEKVQDMGDQHIATLQRDGFVVKKISVYKSGIRYDAALIGHESTINNGKWTISALGNLTAMEEVFQSTALENFKNKSNTLLMNGPSVEKSEGFPTRYQMGAGFEAGLQLLEKKVKATHIAMYGISLGGGMMAEAVLNHKFTTNRKYLFIADRTFNTLSDAAGAMVSSLVKPIFYITGAELDGLSAAKKLSELDISQIVIQHKSLDPRGTDGVIPDRASLGHRLHQEGLSNKIFLESNRIGHNYSLPTDIESHLNQELNRFFQNE